MILRAGALAAAALVSLVILVGCRTDRKASPLAPAPTEVVASPAPSATPGFETPPAQALLPCLEVVAANRPTDRPRELLLATGCLAEPELTATRLLIWNQETGQSGELALPSGARDLRASSDLGRILFRTEFSELTAQLGMLDRPDGQSSTLVTVDLDEVLQRNPDAHDVGLEYGWIGDTSLVYFATRPQYELGLGPYDSIETIEATSGGRVSLVPPGEVMWVRYSPQGGQVSALRPGELWLIDGRTGQVQSKTALSWNGGVENPMQYSLDGRYLTVLTESGVAIIDARSGASREISLAYRLWGAGDWYLFVSRFQWGDPATGLVVVAPPLEGSGEGLDLFDELLDWEIVTYRLSAEEGSLHPMQSYRGFYPSAAVSPDLRLLAFEKAIRDSETRDLYIAEIGQGPPQLYTTGILASFVGWAPDSNRFFFAVYEGPQLAVYLGQLEQAPIRFEVQPDSILWMDAQFFVARPAGSALELYLYSVNGSRSPIVAGHP